MKGITTSRNQEQFWLLQKIYKDNSAYNIASVFEIKGKLNFSAFEKAVNTIIRKLHLNISIEPIKLMEYPNIKELAKCLMTMGIEQSSDEKSSSVFKSRKQNFSALRERRKIN